MGTSQVPNEQHAPIAEALSEANQTIELMQQDATEKASTSTIQQSCTASFSPFLIAHRCIALPRCPLNLLSFSPALSFAPYLCLSTPFPRLRLSVLLSVPPGHPPSLPLFLPHSLPDHHPCGSQARLAVRGELTAGYPDGFDWAHESLEGVPLLDPAWKGKRPDQIIPILVEDLSTLHERYLLDVWAAASEGVDKVICSLLAAGVNLPERVLVALKAGQPTQPPRDRVGEWATMQGREDKLRPAGVSVVALGETGEAREVDGTSYGGLVVIRDDVWGLQETRNVIRSVWRASGKQGERGRGLRALLRGELVEKHGSTHPGLICADAINFEAACWRHQAVEPQVGQHT